MADRSSPRVVLASTIKALEQEMQTALAACPARQRFELAALQQRLERLKASAAAMTPPKITQPRATAR
jgi:hypothetical protein